MAQQKQVRLNVSIMGSRPRRSGFFPHLAVDISTFIQIVISGIINVRLLEFLYHDLHQVREFVAHGNCFLPIHLLCKAKWKGLVAVIEY